MPNDIVKADPEQLKRVESALQERLAMYAAVLPLQLSPQRLVRSALVACQQNPDLLECTKESMLVSIMRSAMLGLDLTGANEAYLVPFRNGKTGEMEAQLIPDYRGLEKLARQGGVVSIEATCVYDGERFEVRKGTVERGILHEPKVDLDRADEKIVAVYAVAYYTNGAPPQFEVMSHEEVERIRQRSRAKNAPAWSFSWGEMAKKTVVRRMCKHLPQSPQMANAMRLEEMAEKGTASIALPGVDDWREARQELPPPAPPATPDVPDTIVLGQPVDFVLASVRESGEMQRLAFEGWPENWHTGTWHKEGLVAGQAYHGKVTQIRKAPEEEGAEWSKAEFADDSAAFSITIQEIEPAEEVAGAGDPHAPLHGVAGTPVPDEAAGQQGEGEATGDSPTPSSPPPDDDSPITQSQKELEGDILALGLDDVEKIKTTLCPHLKIRKEVWDAKTLLAWAKEQHGIADTDGEPPDADAFEAYKRLLSDLARKF